MSHKRALNHFKKADKKLHKAATSLPKGELEVIALKIARKATTKELFEDLCGSIIGQQLSGKAADTIYDRFEGLCKKVTPENILSKNLEELRGVGISYAKGRALIDLAEHVKSGSLNLKKLLALPDLQVTAELVKVKGIGPWTAEMILMFSLGREDVFSVGDLGLQNACVKLYGLKKRPDKVKLQKLSQPWAPYRTWAARILWRYLDEQKKKAP